jgi:hypothetical protein
MFWNFFKHILTEDFDNCVKIEKFYFRKKINYEEIR